MNPPESEQLPMRYYGNNAGWNQLSLAELISYRELFWAFAMRDLMVRYRQAIVGVLWAIVQPVSKLMIFSLIFGLLHAKPQAVSDTVVPYTLSALAGLIVWEFLGGVLRDSGDILLNQRNMLTKIYFPRILLPASVVITSGLDFLIGGVLVLIMSMIYGQFLSWSLIAVPLFLLWMVIFSMSWGITFSCLNVLYRDVRFVIPLLLQIGFFLSPVVYEYRALVTTSKYDWIAGLNPMVSIIEGFRWSLYGNHFPSTALLLTSLITTLISIMITLYTYISIEQKMADNL